MTAFDRRSGLNLFLKQVGLRPGGSDGNRTRDRVVLSDLLYIREGVPEKIINIDIATRLGKLTESISTERLIRLSEFLGVMESSLKTHVNRPMLTEVLALSANQSLAKILDDNPMRSR